MALKIDTDITDYWVRASYPKGAVPDSVSTVRNKNNSFRAVLAIDANSDLCCYYEVEEEQHQFECNIIYKRCKSYAVMRMGDTDNFVIILIGEKGVCKCVSGDLKNLVEDDFEILDDIPTYNGIVPQNVYANAHDGKVSFAVTVKEANGVLKQYVAEAYEEDSFRTNFFPLAEDFSSISDSVCGRADNQPVDGIYTFGNYCGNNQLLYTPVANVYGNTPPTPLRLSVPQDGFEHMALCKCLKSEETHLICAGNGAVYFYDSDKQHDFRHVDYCNYEKKAESEYFRNVKKVKTYIDEKHGKFYVLVLNEEGNLAYTFAELSEDGKPCDFVKPMLFTAEKTSDFDISENVMTMCVKDSFIFGTMTESGGFSFRRVNIKLEENSTEMAQYKVFMTRILVDKKSTKIRIESEEPVEAYINNKYYCLTDGKSVTAEPDSFGGINVIQPISDTAPGSFNITEIPAEEDTDTVKKACKGESYFAGKKSLNRLLELNTPEKLKNALIMHQDGSTRPLAKDLDDDDIKLAADTINELAMKIKEADRKGGLKKLTLCSKSMSLGDFFYSVKEGFDAAVEFVKNLTKKVVSFVTEIVEGAIRFVIKIGAEVICFVIDTIGKCLECILKILEFIGIPIDDIIAFLLQFLDIEGTLRLRTAFLHVISYADTAVISVIENIRGKYDDFLDGIINDIDKYIDNIDDSLQICDSHKDASFSQTPSSISMYNEVFGIGDAFSLSPDIALDNSVLNVFSGLEVSENVKNIVDKVIKEISEIIYDISECKSIKDFINVLKKFFAVMARDILTVARDEGDTIFEVIEETFESIWKSLTECRYIPVISEVLGHYGINEISYVDLAITPFAFMFNLVYHIIEGRSAISEEELQVFLGAGLSDISEVINKKFCLLKSDFEDSDETMTESNKIVTDVCRILMGITYLTDTAINDCSIVLDIKGKSGFASDTIISFISFVSTAGNFAISLVNAFGGGYSPMPYYDTEPLTILWIVSSTVNIGSCIYSMGTSIPEYKKLNLLSIFISIVGAVLQIAEAITQACYLAESSDQKSEYEHSEDYYIYDKGIYTEEAFTYMLSDLSGVISLFSGYVIKWLFKSDNPVTVAIGATLAISAGVVCSTLGLASSALIGASTIDIKNLYDTIHKKTNLCPEIE
ncbi:MAG: methyl-accepting chemotaxis protein [Oscillospiraceae bacterium]|nr:methyl-accepting chemotaxis protein [Oscillospiraceae bacterium]